MTFHEKLKTFREEQLEIPQKEAALLLGVSQTVLSRYEAGTRSPSIETVLLIRDKYNMTHEQFLELLSITPTQRRPAETLVEEAHETKKKYYSQFDDLLEELMKGSAFRRLLLELEHLSSTERNAFLQAILNRQP